MGEKSAKWNIYFVVQKLRHNVERQLQEHKIKNHHFEFRAEEDWTSGKTRQVSWAAL